MWKTSHRTVWDPIYVMCVMGMMCMLITSETKRINIHSHTHIWATHTKRGGWGDLGLLSDTDVYTHTTFTPVELLSL